MESLTETLLFILPWILLGTSLIFYGRKQIQSRYDLNEALIINRKLKEAIIEKDLIIEEIKQKTRKWEKLATCPPISPPIEYRSVLDKTDIKIISSRIKIPQHHRYGKVTKDNHKYHQAYLKAEHDFLQQLSKYVYSELTDKGYEAEYYQEIYVANPKKLHYEK